MRDILETGLPLREKAYAFLSTAHGATAEDAIARRQRNAAAEPVQIKPLTEREMEYMLRETKDGRNHFDFDYHHDASRDKSSCVTANTHRGVPYNVLVEPVAGEAEPAAMRQVGRRINEQGHRDDYNEAIPHFQYFEVNDNPQKTNCLSTVEKDNMIAVPVRVGDMPNAEGVIRGGQAHRIYDSGGKAVTLTARPNGGGVDGPLYATPCCMRYERTEEAKKVRKQYEAHEVRHGFHELSELHPRTDGKSNTLSTVLKDNPICEQVLERDESGKWAVSCADGKKYPVYEVYGGLITVKGKKYPIRLKDGFYIIRKLTVTECKRLQTVPDEFVFPVSDSQAYKMLGNGWTVDVIAHIMSHFSGLTTEPVEVLSMYDGMSCGHIALNKLGAEVASYHATEIDKYAIQTTQHNFPETVQLGDAFQVRDEGWSLEELMAGAQRKMKER